MATTNFGCPATRQNVMTSRRFYNCGSVVVVLPALFVVVGLLTTTSCDNVEASSGSAGSSSVADPIVSTLLGRVRGLRSYVPALGREVDAFLGIPFARPPRGRLRFRHPLPAEPWAPHIYNATRLPDSCHQKPDTAFGDFYGSTVWNSPTPVSEDCLYLNVYVPRNPTVDSSKGSGSGGGPRGRRRGPGGRRSLAVMVWIFGGGFYSGTTTLGLYDGKILSVLGDVIVVSIGYRLGALGFLSLGGHREAPGNAGLFDQLMGLDWVQQNIEYFGGDPNNVTLFGESAGSVSVSLHLLSPLSHGKFNRAIMQSGTASMPWAVTSQAEAKRRSLELAVDVIGCQKSNDMMDIVECLRQTPASIIVNEQWVSRGIVQFPFVPIVDGVFLPDEPEELLLRKEFKRCPILMGSNENEASFFMIYELSDLLTLESRSMTSAQYRNSIDRLFEFYPQFRPHHQLSNQALNAIKNQYKPWLDPEDTDRNINALDMAVSDSQFVCPLNNFGHRYALSGQDVFMYFFTERTQYNPWPPWMGVLHGDEIFLVFGEPIKYRANFTNNERLLAQQMISYWTNFAKTGNPNHSNDPRAKPVGVTWPVHTPAGKEYLDLNSRYFVGSDKGTTGSSSSPAESVGSRSMAAMTSRATGRGPRANECGFWNEYLPDLMTFSDTDPRAVGDFPSTSSSPAAPVTTVACCEQPATSSAAAAAAPHSLRFRHQRQQQLPLLRSTWCWQVVLAVVAAATWTELLTGENKWPER